MTENNSIFIGNGPFMNYITSVVMQFTTEESNEVVIRARGKLISRAVDVAEAVVNEFLNEVVKVKDVRIGSDIVKEDDREIRVSAIDIYLEKIE